MKTTKQGVPGTVSYGTLNTRDLIETFAYEYECITGKHWRVTRYDEEELEELLGALEALAPDGHYFGAHPGDCADFGFWEQ